MLGSLALPGLADVSVHDSDGLGLGFRGGPAQACGEAEHQALALTTGWRQVTEPPGLLPAIEGQEKIAEFIRRWAAAAATSRAIEFVDGAQTAALWAELRALRELPEEPYDWTLGLVLSVFAAGGSLAERGALADTLADAGPEQSGTGRAAEYVVERSASDRLVLVTNPASAGQLVRLVHESSPTVDQYYGALLGPTLSALLPSPALAVDLDVPTGFVVIRAVGLDVDVLPLPDRGTMLVPFAADVVRGMGEGFIATAVVPGRPEAPMALVADGSAIASEFAAGNVQACYYLAAELAGVATANAAGLVRQERLTRVLDSIYNAGDNAHTVWFARKVYGDDELLVAVRQLLRAGLSATALPTMLRELVLQDGAAALDAKVAAAVDLTRHFLEDEIAVA